MTQAAVALGSNLGDRLDHMRQGLAGLRRLGQVVAVSSLYETAPVGGPEQGPYLNAVAALETDLDPTSLLAGLQAVEAEAGRQRVERWGPRTLDLDLITYGDEETSSDELTLPHPRAAERRFVLEPLAEAMPAAELGGVRVGELLAGVDGQKVHMVASMWDGDLVFAGSGRPWIIGQLAIAVVWAVVLVTTGSLDPGWPARLTGWVLAGLGLLVVAAAVRALGSAMTVDPIPRRAGLAQRGPFRFVRHPTYTGVVLLLIGLSISFGSWPAAAVVVGFAVFFYFKAGTEERYLRVLYPDYHEYEARVRGRLLPR
jgi:2-amino-4-hydroxy-6-hydroxymethyldihydropteridine diphosphokinase